MELRQLCRSERLPEQLSVFLRPYSSSTMTSVHFDHLKHHFHLFTSRHCDGLVIIYLVYCSYNVNFDFCTSCTSFFYFIQNYDSLALIPEKLVWSLGCDDDSVTSWECLKNAQWNLDSHVDSERLPEQLDSLIWFSIWCVLFFVPLFLYSIFSVGVSIIFHLFLLVDLQV